MGDVVGNVDTGAEDTGADDTGAGVTGLGVTSFVGDTVGCRIKTRNKDMSNNG